MKIVTFFILIIPCVVLADCVEPQKPTSDNTPEITNVIVQTPMPATSYAVTTQPPVDLAEVSSPAPGSTEQWAWQRGYWQWNDKTYVWVAGKWARRPNYGAEWLAPHWDHQATGGWVFIEGKWR